MTEFTQPNATSAYVFVQFIIEGVGFVECKRRLTTILVLVLRMEHSRFLVPLSLTKCYANAMVMKQNKHRLITCAEILRD